MNVLSLFDGMSCGQIALNELGIKVDNYIASEIDKYAIKQTQHNFPDTIHLGGVTKVRGSDLPKIDLLIGGSPCQGFSFAGKQLNFRDRRSVLFFEYVRILKELREINPNIKFLFENVRMKRQFEAVISKHLGLHPVMINSALVSAQNRVRLYWTNIRTRSEGLFPEIYTDIPQPQDRGLLLRDILETNVPERYFIPENVLANMLKHKKRQKAAGNGFGIDIRRAQDKSCSLTVGGNMMRNLVEQPVCAAKIRRLTPKECARLQTIPDWYEFVCSETQIYKMLGNGWTIDVIKHIFNMLKS
jgi:DNA-cytosine methyltransferase